MIVSVVPATTGMTQLGNDDNYASVASSRRRILKTYFSVSPQNSAMPKSKTTAPTTDDAPETVFTLDAFDRKILAHYQHDVKRPAALIGEEVGLSAAAVQRRIKRMREAGVIRAEIADIDPAKVGLPVTVIVHVDIEKETLHYIDAFKAQMRARPEVQQCWYTTGITDFILVVRVESMAAYEQFTRDALVGLDNVARFTSYVVLGEVKAGLGLSLTSRGSNRPLQR
jgi:Lrp/AsnC family transcriptional regulator, leucine-responsive regulatory protein